MSATKADYFEIQILTTDENLLYNNTCYWLKYISAYPCLNMHCDGLTCNYLLCK